MHKYSVLTEDDLLKIKAGRSFLGNVGYYFMWGQQDVAYQQLWKARHHIF